MNDKDSQEDKMDSLKYLIKFMHKKIKKNHFRLQETKSNRGHPIKK